MLLLLIENWYQYPGKEKWNIFSFANFCMVVPAYIWIIKTLSINRLVILEIMQDITAPGVSLQKEFA